MTESASGLASVSPSGVFATAVAWAADAALSVRWTPERVDSRAHVRHGSALECVDLAVPCFSLARSLGRSPDQVAGSLVTALEQVSADRSLDGWRYEANSGYINAHLSQPAVQGFAASGACRLLNQRLRPARVAMFVAATDGAYHRGLLPAVAAWAQWLGYPKVEVLDTENVDEGNERITAWLDANAATVDGRDGSCLVRADQATRGVVLVTAAGDEIPLRSARGRVLSTASLLYAATRVSAAGTVILGPVAASTASALARYCSSSDSRPVELAALNPSDAELLIATDTCLLAVTLDAGLSRLATGVLALPRARTAAWRFLDALDAASVLRG